MEGLPKVFVAGAAKFEHFAAGCLVGVAVVALSPTQPPFPKRNQNLVPTDPIRYPGAYVAVGGVLAGYTASELAGGESVGSYRVSATN